MNLLYRVYDLINYYILYLITLLHIYFCKFINEYVRDKKRTKTRNKRKRLGKNSSFLKRYCVYPNEYWNRS